MGDLRPPSAETHKSKGLTDARISMTLMTLIASGWALALLRSPRKQKTPRRPGPARAADGRAVSLDRRRRHADPRSDVARGRGAAASTEQPRRHQPRPGRGDETHGVADGHWRAPRRAEPRRSLDVDVACFFGSCVIVAVTTVPFVVRAPAAFMSNVFAFPLGFAGVTSPAASALPGHILTTLGARARPRPGAGHVPDRRLLRDNVPPPALAAHALAAARTPQPPLSR